MQHYKKAVGSVKKGKKSASGKLRKGAAVARSSVASVKGRRAAAAGKPKLTKTKARTVKQYDHPTKTRLNNPPVGLVTPDTDPDLAPKSYAYDPHLDPQLVWAGKAEKAAMTVDTVSLHVHERIDPYTIMEAVRTKQSFIEQQSLFSRPAENPPLREALDFYKHQHGWSNRLIAGDSLLVMNSLLEREGLEGGVQMVYVDPPYGITYKSNFQPFVNQRKVGDRDEDLTNEPEMIRAFRDTWELGVHSYLGYLRDRLMLARELLSDSGSCFVQISDENLHRVSIILDEIFGSDNFVSIINYVTGAPRESKLLENNCNYIVWYARNKPNAKFRQIFRPKPPLGDEQYKYVQLPDAQRRIMTSEERAGRTALPPGSKIFRLDALHSTRMGSEEERFSIEVAGVTYPPPKTMWQTGPDGIERLKKAGRIMVVGSTPQYVRYLDDFPAFPIGTQWTDTTVSGFGQEKKYVVQTNPLIIRRCMLMCSDPGDLVFDPTCGSGTTPFVAEQLGRRWITCDTSRVAITLSRQRLMTSIFPYYQLIAPEEGVDGGLRYRTVPHIRLSTVANNEPALSDPLYDQPVVDASKARVTGPFTMEAVPAPMVTSLNSSSPEQTGDASISRSGATIRESDWRSELLKSGVRGLRGKFIRFSRVEPLAATSFIHAEGQTMEDEPQRVAISFGPAYAPLEQRQVLGAWREAQKLNPSPTILLFAAFQFDPEAAKDIDEMDPRLTKMTFLKVQMDMDLLTHDLKKKRSTNEAFWLIGRPDVEVERIMSGPEKGKYSATIHGFDYYDVKTGVIESGNTDRIAMWMLDTDYDERSLFPRQVFFPMAAEKDGWWKVVRALKADIDLNLINAYRGTVSIPFEAGKNGRIAVKIIDDRGVESMRVMKIS